jgi:hypothetical protein
MKNIVLIVITLLAITTCYGQIDSNNIRVFASPGEYYRVKIDNHLQPVSSKFHLDPGKYNISIWAPNYFQFDTTIIVGDDKMFVRTELKKTHELIKYEQLNSKHKIANKRISMATFSLVALSAGMIINFNQLGADKLELIKAEYSHYYTGNNYSAPDELKQAQNKHNFGLVRQGILYTGIGLSTIAIIRYIKRRSTIEIPSLPDDNLFERVDIGLISIPDSNLGLQIQINLAGK